MRMIQKWHIVIIVLCIPVLIWALSLLKCEVLTQAYCDDFEFAYTSNSMLGDMEYFKVLSCNGKTARVYYVSEGMEDAHVLSFEKRDGKWTETMWETIWSDSGAASEVIYPYWWHFIYGGL